MPTERCFYGASTHPFGEPRPICFRAFQDMPGNYAFAITWNDKWSRIHDMHCAFEYHHPTFGMHASRKGPSILEQCSVHSITGELDANKIPIHRDPHTMMEIGKLKLWMKMMKLVPLS